MDTSYEKDDTPSNSSDRRFRRMPNLFYASSRKNRMNRKEKIKGNTEIVTTAKENPAHVNACKQQIVNQAVRISFFNGERSEDTDNAITCCICHERTHAHIFTRDQYFHPECFKCVACNDVIRHPSKFSFVDMYDEKGVLIHEECFTELFRTKCIVCNKHSSDYSKHIFFENEIMCNKHLLDKTRQCGACKRYEPSSIGRSFIEVNDGSRCLCPSCHSTVITDTLDAQPLWNIILDFFQNTLQLRVWDEMRSVPVVIVGS